MRLRSSQDGDDTSDSPASGNLSLSVLGDVSGYSEGWQLTLAPGRTFLVGPFAVTPSAAATWLGDQAMNHDHGVEASEATATRHAYAPGATVNLQLGLRTTYRIAPRQALFLDVNATRLGQEIKDGPPVDRSSLAGFQVGDLYRLRGPQAAARSRCRSAAAPAHDRPSGPSSQESSARRPDRRFTDACRRGRRGCDNASPCAVAGISRANMNRIELIELLAERHELSKAEAGRVLATLLDAVVTTVKKGQTVSLVGFGTFKQSARAARTGRNPSTGAPVKIAATKVPRFVAGAGFKDAVDAKAAARRAAKKVSAAPAKKAAAKAPAKKAPAKKAAAKKAR